MESPNGHPEQRFDFPPRRGVFAAVCGVLPLVIAVVALWPYLDVRILAMLSTATVVLLVVLIVLPWQWFLPTSPVV